MKRVKWIEDGVRLRIQHDDDLWTLSQLIRPGTSVGMNGFRRDGSHQDSVRAKAAERKPMWIVLQTQHIEFQPFTDNLRVHGIITEAAQDKGSHHTHAIAPRNEVEITWKGGVSDMDKALMAEALQDSGRGRVGIIVIESDEVMLFEVAQHGMRDVSQFTMRGGGKREGKSTEVRASFLRGTAKEVAMVFDDSMPLVLCGPGFAREQFESILKETGGNYRTLNIATSIGGRAAANEVMRDGAADNLLGDFAMAKQIRLIEEGLTRIATNGHVAYGHQSILNALEQAAIETLVIDASLLRDDSMCGERTWSDVAEDVKTSNGEVVQASLEHDAGEQLVELGPIALLRWAIE